MIFIILFVFYILILFILVLFCFPLSRALFPQGGGCVTRCKASFLCLAFRPRWRLATAGGASPMVMRRQCFLEGMHASEPRVLGGPAGAAGQEGEGGGDGGPRVAARMEV